MKIGQKRLQSSCQNLSFITMHTYTSYSLSFINYFIDDACFWQICFSSPSHTGVVVTAIRDGDEDLGHHQLDDRKNNCMSLLLQDGQYMYKIRKYNFVERC